MTVATESVSRLLLAPTWIVAFAILVKGYVEAGDGFAAGVVAALGVLLQYLVFGVERAEQLTPVRHINRLAQIGLLITLIVAFTPVLFGKPVLTHWPPVDQSVIHIGTVEVITAVVFDIGVFLLVFSFCVATLHLMAHATQRSRR
jgi:multisubunit Na+/H+ antiporter MnhB subunit